MNNIHKDLLALAVDIDSIEARAVNPRRGNIEAIKASYQRFGQRKPITVNRETNGSSTTAGNHQLMAAKELGWDKIAVIWTDDDEETANAWMIADNRTSDLAYNDPGDLYDILSGLDDLDGTGYSIEEVDDMLKLFGQAPDLDDLFEDVGEVTEEDALIRVSFRAEKEIADKWRAILKATQIEQSDQAAAAVIEAAYNGLISSGD